MWRQSPTRLLSFNDWTDRGGRRCQRGALAGLQQEGGGQACGRQSVAGQRVHQRPVQHVRDQVADQLQRFLPVRRRVGVSCSYPTTRRWHGLQGRVQTTTTTTTTNIKDDERQSGRCLYLAWTEASPGETVACRDAADWGANNNNNRSWVTSATRYCHMTVVCWQTHRRSVPTGPTTVRGQDNRLILLFILSYLQQSLS